MTALECLTRFNHWCDRHRLALYLPGAMLGGLVGIAEADDPPKPTPAPLPVAAVVLTPSGTVAPGTPVTIDATTSTGDDVQIVSTIDPAVFKPGPTDRVAYLFTITEGTYAVTIDAASIVDGKLKRNLKAVSIVIQATKPVVPPVINPPSPPPNPPTPTNPPFADKLHAVLIWDAENDEPSSAAVRVSQVSSQLAMNNTAWYVRTKAQESTRYAKQLAITPAPAVYFLDDNGNAKGSLPITAESTPADVVAKVKAIRAGN